MIKITPDKWKHFFVGLVLGAIASLFLYYFFRFQLATIIAVSLGTVATISYVFELFSMVTGKGHHEIMDAIAGIIGGAVGISIVLFILL
jgi:hypothetical protein